MDNHSQVICHLYGNEKSRLHNSWKNQIASSNPKLFLSLAFQPPKLKLVNRAGSSYESTTSKSTNHTISPDTAIRISNEVLKRTYQRIYGRSQTKFEGYGCLEYQKSQLPHLHILLTNDVDPNKFLCAYQRVINNARKHGKPFLLLDSNSLDVQPVHDAARLSEYVTKLFNHWDNGERMLLVDGNQIFE